MSASHLRFGDFELDVARYELARNARPIKLERIPMELLVLLVDRRGQLVTRKEILETLWGKDVFLDADNSINTAISKLRLALKDDAETPAFIKTVPGKGYRFICSIAVRVATRGFTDIRDAFQGYAEIGAANCERARSGWHRGRQRDAIGKPRAYYKPSYLCAIR